MTFLGSQGLLLSPSYEKLVGCCPTTRGSAPSVTLPFPLPSSRIHCLIPRLLGPLIISGREEGMFLFSLLIFSVTKNCPRMNDMHVPVDQSTLVLARMGWTQLTGSHPSLPFHARPPTQGTRALFSGGCRAPGYLDNRGFMRPCRRSRGPTARLSLERVPCQGHSHPTLCFFEIQTKGCFSMFKENKKKKE